MALEIPVVATYVGGLQDSILHLGDHHDTGSGLLCLKEDRETLKYALVSLLRNMQINEEKTKNLAIRDTDIQPKFAQIVHPVLLGNVQHDLTYGSVIRNNAYERVESTFRWMDVSRKLKTIYLNLI